MDYWSRRSGADKLARSAQVPRLLSAIENIANQGSREKTLLIYMGHSMGARILYNGVAPRLVHNVQTAYPANPGRTFQILRPGPDLILMINPALEAASYKSIDEFRYAKPNFDDDQLPVMLTIQSEGDWITRSAFAFAESLGWLNDPYQSAQRRRSIGHSESQFQTHRLVKRGSEDECEKDSKINLTSAFCAEKAVLLSCPEPGYLTVRDDEMTWDTRCLGGSEIDDHIKCPKKKNCNTDRCLHKTPFLVVRADKGILKSHGFFLDEKDKRYFPHQKVDGDGFIDWLHAYIDEFERTTDQKRRAKIASESDMQKTN